MRLKLFLSILLFCAIAKAQTATELKNFLNKNNIALRSVHKNMLHGTNSSYMPAFKEILKKQQSAVKLYAKDKTASTSYALSVRNECLVFLKKYTKGSTEYFEFTESEKRFEVSEKSIPVLSDTEIKSIENLDITNPQSLNALALTIQ
jgi:hypothetical protein